MKILYIACLNSPLDHNAGSGVDYDLHAALVGNGAEVRVSGPFPFHQTLPERLARKIHRMLFKRRSLKYPVSFLQFAGRAVMQDIADYRPDVIFSKYAMILSRVKTDVPIVSFTDTPLLGNQQQWPMFSPIAFARQKRWEQTAYNRSRMIITQSRWAADMLVEDYRQARQKTHVIPAPASIPQSVVPAGIAPNPLEPVKILLVGRDYRRKGVDIAIGVVNRLNARGVPALLRIVGLDGEQQEFVQFMGLYNKTVPEQLGAYIANYRWANFLIHPARFEAAGIVPSEAAAFGVPTITNNAGGLGTTVEDGRSGFVLPRNSPSQAYVEVLERISRSPAEYQALCQSTRTRYEAELNWEAAGQRVFQIVQSAAAGEPS